MIRLLSPSSPSPLNRAVRETGASIPKQLVARQYFLPIRCVLSHYNLFHSVCSCYSRIPPSPPSLILACMRCLYSALDLESSPRPQAVGPVHQLQLLGETTSELGPFGGPKNNMNGRAEGQEAQPDRLVLRKALFSKKKTKKTMTKSISA